MLEMMMCGLFFHKHLKTLNRSVYEGALKLPADTTKISRI